MKNTIYKLAILTSLLFIPGLAFAESRCNASNYQDFIWTEGVHNCDLRGVDFSGQDLSGANFSGADLYRARFISRYSPPEKWTFHHWLFPHDPRYKQKTVLNTANFEGANMRETILHRVRARESNFSGVDFTGSVLKFTDFSGANFYEANLQDTKAEWSHFYYADISFVNFDGARLMDLGFREVDFKDVDFSGATITTLQDWETGLFDYSGVTISNNYMIWGDPIDFSDANTENTTFKKFEGWPYFSIRSSASN